MRRKLLLLSVSLTTVAWAGCEGALTIQSSQRETPPDDPEIELDLPPRTPPADGGSAPPPATPDASQPPECTPRCTDRECGPDGCGGTCGPGCDTGSACGDSGLCEPFSEHCPPIGPEGTTPGDIVPDFALPLADGGELSIRELCHHRTVFLYRYSASCGICRTWMREDAEALQQELQELGFQMVIVAGNVRRPDGSYGVPDAESASALAREFGLSMPISYETDRQFLRNLGTSGPGVGLLMREGNELATWVDQISNSTLRRVAAEGASQ